MHFDIEPPVRIAGMLIAAIAVGLGVATLRVSHPPGRIWLILSIIGFDTTLLYYRIRALQSNSELNTGDIGFLVSNVLVVIACVVFLQHSEDWKLW